MANSSSTTSTEDLVEWGVGASVGLGVITMALFPFALPLLVLTAAALIPLLLIPLAGLLIAAPFLLLRRLLRRAPRSRRATSAASRDEAVMGGARLERATSCL